MGACDFWVWRLVGAQLIANVTRASSNEILPILRYELQFVGMQLGCANFIGEVPRYAHGAPACTRMCHSLRLASKLVLNFLASLVLWHSGPVGNCPCRLTCTLRSGTRVASG